MMNCLTIFTLLFHLLGTEKKDAIFLSACHGHTIGFIIIKDSAIRFESYRLLLKVNQFSMKAEDVPGNELAVINETEVKFRKAAYSSQPGCDKWGDFSLLYEDFERLSIAEKLNVCRNINACRKKVSGKRNLAQVIKDNYSIMVRDTADFNNQVR